MFASTRSADDGDEDATVSLRARRASFAPGAAEDAPHACSDRRRDDECDFWRAIAENLPDFVLAIGADGNVLFVNRVGPPLTVSALQGRSWTALAHPDYEPAFRQHFDTVLRTGESITFEAPSPHHAGVSFSCRMGPIRRDGRIAGAVVSAHDISELRRTNARMMMADRLASVGSLAAGVAHEINNLLSSIRSNVEVAVSELEALVAPASVLEPLRDAALGTDRVQQIVRDLKLFSRVDEEAAIAVDLPGVVASTLRLAAKQLEGRARLVVDLQPVPPVLANQARLGQVVLNLVVNALQAVPEGSANENVVSVSTRQRGDHVVIAVADTGCGIPDAILPQLFEPFFTTKPAGVGTGLGLSICQQIVTALGGTIELTTEVGRGTEFRVVLPACLPVSPEPAVAVPHAGAVAPPRGRILVVDDEPLIRRAIERILRSYDVTTAESAVAAYQLLLAGQRYDLVLCDLQMPEMDGPELDAAIARDMPELRDRLVFMSGGACTQTVRDFLVSVEDRYIEKPFTADSLRRVVSTWFALHEPAAAP